MCNSYRIEPARRGEQSIAGRVADAVERLKSELVRKSDPGLVMRADGRVEVMRWGFRRSFNPSINNARSGKLEAGMWREAFHERRCVIPVSLLLAAGICLLREAPERAIGSDRRAGKWGLIDRELLSRLAATGPPLGGSRIGREEV